MSSEQHQPRFDECSKSVCLEVKAGTPSRELSDFVSVMQLFMQSFHIEERKVQVRMKRNFSGFEKIVAKFQVKLFI